MQKRIVSNLSQEIKILKNNTFRILLKKIKNKKFFEILKIYSFRIFETFKLYDVPPDGGYGWWIVGSVTKNCFFKYLSIRKSFNKLNYDLIALVIKYFLVNQFMVIFPFRRRLSMSHFFDFESGIAKLCFSVHRASQFTARDYFFQEKKIF